MPIYPFRCDPCDVEFEVTRKASAARDAAACPFCGKPARRVFTAIGRSGASVKSGAPSVGAAPAGGGAGTWSHGGHSHGAGESGHSHSPGAGA